jgi:hypothetical protein
MAWPFLMLVRDEYRAARSVSEGNWGRLYTRSIPGRSWDFFSYAYELPWIQTPAGLSKNKKSQIDIGTYELNERNNGPKGWRLELLETGHREHIQVHRAHKSMYIEGCILPVKFRGFGTGNPLKGDANIQTDSVELMKKLRALYEARAMLAVLKAAVSAFGKGKSQANVGRATILISAKLPASISDGTMIA